MLFCRNKQKEKMSLLKPQFTFHLMIWTIPIFVIWLIAIFIVGTDLTMTTGSAIGFSILVAFVGSILSIALTFWFHYFWTKNIWSCFERGCQETLPELEEMGQYVRVEIELNDESETQSMATNVSRFMNYRVTNRAAFFGQNHNNSRNQQTILVPEHNPSNDERFRASVNSNFGRSRGQTARTESENGDARTVHVIDVAMNSNGFSTYGVQPGASVAKYKMVSDPSFIGDRRLLNQESTSFKNVQSLIFYVCVVLLL
mmetsp:Transcript_12502/g.14310  ORF Transcript_12502/g.14310 Transcript_12502/m.14310 type:complete len:257 (+) Transcript_12502:347-1117(+)